jgi:hypothetical protein
MNTNSNNKSICFVANFYKTFLFHALALELQQRGISIYWIVTKSDQYAFLVDHYGKENVLYINRTFISKTATPVSDFKLNELVFGDRVLKHEKKNAIDFLINIQKPIYDFIQQHKIRFIFGEVTWAHEILLMRMAKQCKELNSIYLECTVIRLPNNRSAFFTDEHQCNVIELNNEISTDEIIKVVKPAYLQLNDILLQRSMTISNRLMRIKRFITGENIEKNDPNVLINKWMRFKEKFQEELNKNTYAFIKTTNLKDIENEQFIFYGLHKQPEASIDVLGRYYEDQTVVILNLWRLLPTGWKVVVKEHTNAIGDRSYSFYKNLLSYPNIILADETINAKLLIEKCQLVASISGTIAYEAALMKTPAITLSPVFFNRINYCRHISINELFEYDSIITLIEELRSAEDNRLEFSNYILKNSFDGYISDYVSDPNVMNKENIKKLSAAYLKLINESK